MHKKGGGGRKERREENSIFPQRISFFQINYSKKLAEQVHFVVSWQSQHLAVSFIRESLCKLLFHLRIKFSIVLPFSFPANPLKKKKKEKRERERERKYVDIRVKDAMPYTFARTIVALFIIVAARSCGNFASKILPETTRALIRQREFFLWQRREKVWPCFHAFWIIWLPLQLALSIFAHRTARV